MAQAPLGRLVMGGASWSVSKEYTDTQLSRVNCEHTFLLGAGYLFGAIT